MTKNRLMPAVEKLRRRKLFLLIAVAALLQGCSALPQLVRHSDPLTPEEHVRLGASYEAQGLQDNALEQYRAALRLQKNNLPALAARGNLAFEHGDWKQAEACYRRMLRLNPAHAGANNNLAMVYLARGKHLDKAERAAQTALLQGGPLKPYVLDTLASIYIEESRYSEAQQALEEAATVAPKDNQPLHDQLARTGEKLHAAVRRSRPESALPLVQP